MKKSALFVTTVFSLWAAHANAAADMVSLPMEVMKEVQKLEADCKANPVKTNRIATDLAQIKSADLNGDGLADFIIEDYYVPCEMGASFRHGNGGTGIIIHVGTKTGSVKAYEDTIHEFALRGNKAYVVVGGHLCGQKSFASRADAIACERQLQWSAAKKRFEYAPLSQAKILQ